MNVVWFKKLCVLCLVVGLIIPSNQLAGAAPAKETIEQHWAGKLMQDWVAKGNLKGYPDGQLHPDRQITRAEFITILTKVLPLEESSTSSKAEFSFTDVHKEQWYYTQIQQAVVAGYIKGYPDGSFKPNALISRQEAAVILVKRLRLSASESSILESYHDYKQIPVWAQPSVATLLNHSLIQGYPDQTLRTTKQLTRAEAVTLVNHAHTYETNTESNESPTAPNQPGTELSNLTTSSGDGLKNTSSKAKTSTTTLDAKLDSDKDGLPDYIEDILGTNKYNRDTDGDGLSDGEEVNTVGTDPLQVDTNKNGISDAKEDGDGDGLSNSEELRHHTDPKNADTDFDGWADGLEIQKGTNPLVADTDKDGLEDGIEESVGMNPLLADTNGNGIKDGDEKVVYTTKAASYDIDPNVVPTVKLASKAKLADSTVITNVYGEDAFINSDIPGYLGAPYEFKTDVAFDSAEMTFTYDPNLVTTDFEPAIYYYNKDKQLLERVPDQVHHSETHSVTATVHHFSTYLLLDGKKWDEVWQKEMLAPNALQKQTDIVFMIDTSGSMEDNDPKNLRLTAVTNFVYKMRELDRAAVYSFNDYASRWTSLTSNKKAIQDAVARVRGLGGTDIYYALSRSIDEIEQNGTANNAKMIILLTDGEGNSNNKKIDGQIARAAGLNIKVYTIGLGASAGVATLEKISQGTGGQYYAIDAAEMVDMAYNAIAGETINLSADSDQDGLPDYFEDNGVRLGNGVWIQGLDAHNPDTDGDGIPDGKELTWLQDQDQPKLVYFTLKSDPTKKDTDEDGLLDGFDPHPLRYDLHNRLATIMADLSYVNLSSEQGQAMEDLKGNTDIDTRFKMAQYNPQSLVNPNPYTELNGWKIIRAQDTDMFLSGFAAVALKRGDTIAFAFRGTEFPKPNDIGADLALFFYNNNQMTWQMDNFMAAVLKEQPHAKVYSIGHSLGGFLASSASYELITQDISLENIGARSTIRNADYTFEQGINFNAAPFFISGYVLPEATGLSRVLAFFKSTVPANAVMDPKYANVIDNYFTEGEFLSSISNVTLGLRLGKVHEPFPSSGSAMERHGISSFYEHFPKSY
ncbi:S-layer homology domain-containing protein [Paenibacillus sp. WLX2291]|uniref:S-layer homology domain-containing protein n=1 Tax=Paenibacillus sp. WLX2291 TaxID=3296934 RepID=UPI0039844EF8